MLADGRYPIGQIPLVEGDFTSLNLCFHHQAKDFESERSTGNGPDSLANVIHVQPAIRVESKGVIIY
jgi:hypothetical protein